MASVFRGLRSVVDIVWQCGQVPIQSQMDTLNTLLLGWLVFGVLLAILAKFLYSRFLAGDNDQSDDYPNAEEEGTPETKLPAEGTKAVPKSEVRKKATIIPAGPPERFSAPLSTGGEPDAVRWINNLLVWFFEGAEGGRMVREAWNDALNEFTVGAALETGVLVEILEFFPQTPAPRLTNIVVDCDPSDNMTLTCDMESVLYLRVQTTRTQREVTTESEYACAVRPLRGRLNVAIRTHECAAFWKLDGWPEVSIELEGVRNNAEGLDEVSLQDVVKEVLTAAIRKVTLDLDFLPKKTFPHFSRARSMPDQVIPIGYDSLVREAQTHPPSFSPKPPASRTLIAVKPPPVKTTTARSSNVMPVKEHVSLTTTNIPTVNIVAPRPITPMKPLLSENQILEEAGESFTSLSSLTSKKGRETANEIPASSLLTANDPKPDSILTVSEESLIARNLELYERNPSFTDCNSIDVSKVIEKYSEEKGDNVIETKKTTSRAQMIDTIDAYDRANDAKRSIFSVNRSSLVFSSREKPIDEPKDLLTGEMENGNNIEDEESLTTNDNNLPKNKSILERRPVNHRNSSPSELDEIKDNIRANPFSQHLPSSVISRGSSLVTSPLPASPLSAPVGIAGLTGKRLLVKVVKASSIGGDKGVAASYVVVEMDEPPQKFSTLPVSESNSPFWDEQFLFDLSDNTLELLFEIYDKEDNRFLGLGIVGIEELVATPSQRQIIPLQARPYENDEVSGSLTCEFLFLDRADLPDLTMRATATSHINHFGNKVKTTTTTYVKQPEEKIADEEVSSDVAAAALKDLQTRRSTSQAQSVPSTKSTLIIHASRKPMDDPRYETPAGVLGYSPQKSSLSTSSPGTIPTIIASTSNNFTSSTHPSSSLPASSPSALLGDDKASSIANSDIDERGRSRNRGGKRDFFGSLRRRFSRSKVRSKSVDPTNVDVNESLDRDVLANRSISVERSTNILRSRGLLKVPTGRGHSSSSGGLGGDTGSTRSSLSGTSGLSSTSTKTYINEASLLVVETLENGVIKHYLVPLSLQRKNKWRKKGTKLHIYNEHTFVAKHVSSSVTCQVCNKTLARRLGKQGYECRDCSFKCHKPCHVKVESVCPNSSVNTMDLVYVKDERTERRKVVPTS